MIYNLNIHSKGGNIDCFENMPLPKLFRQNEYANRYNKEIEAAQKKAEAKQKGRC